MSDACRCCPARPRRCGRRTGLRILAPFESALRANGDLVVTFKTAGAGVEQVLGAVRAAGVTIKDLRTEDPDLEDVFVSLTSGPAKAA